ncbi:MAG: AMIN domain-containing protein [Elusimicrobia bacterium]|nr:AMIN domain-containing protein [Elusimicrobiota bacterium]
MNCLLAAFLTVVPVAGAANLTGVSVGAAGGRLALDAPARFRAFRLGDPDRFVVDLEATAIAIPERTWAGTGAILRMRAAPWGEDPSVLRVVFDLAAPMEGTAREAAGAVVVDFTPPRGRAAVPAPPPHEPEAADMRDALSPLAMPLSVPVLRMPAPRSPFASLLAVRSEPDRAVISLDRPVEPAVFLAEDPPRLVIDFPGTFHAAAAAPAPRPGGVLRAVRSAPFKTGQNPVSRVVLDLSRQAPYSIERNGSEIVVEFNGPAPREVSASRTREWRGWIVDGAGRPLDGVFLVRFSLPDEGGLDDARWTESLYVDARGGRFSAILGRFSPLPSDAVDAGFPLDAAPPPGVSWRVVPR